MSHIALHECLSMLAPALRLPLFLSQGRDHITAYAPLPRGGTPLLSVDQALGEAARAPDVDFPPEIARVQFYLSQYGERYLYLALPDESLLFAGPCLVESNAGKIVESALRAGLLPIKKRKTLEQYFTSLPNLSMESYFYIGRLLEIWLFGTASDQKEGLPSLQTVGPDSEAEKAAPLPPSPSCRQSPTTVLPSDYYVSTMENRRERYLHPPYFLEQEITLTISGGDTRKAVRLLKQLNGLERASLADSPLRSLKNSLIGSCTIFTRAAIKGGVMPDRAFTLSDAYIRQIERCEDMNTLNEIEKSMIMGFTAQVDESREYGDSEPIRRVLHYIDAHLSDELSQRELAAYAYLSANYLSGLFRREMGLTLSQYVRKRRLEAARVMVRFSGNSLADVADFYRFSSQSYFTHCYRLEFGVTPGQDRERG